MINVIIRDLEKDLKDLRAKYIDELTKEKITDYNRGYLAGILASYKLIIKDLKEKAKK